MANQSIYNAFERAREHTIAETAEMIELAKSEINTQIDTHAADTTIHMTSAEKTQLNYGGTSIVTTSGTGAAYTATVDGVTTLTIGMKLTIVPHTNSTATQPTLNVNNLGAKAIRMPTTYNTSGTSVGPIASWLVANKPTTVQYNGTYWITVDLPRPSAQYLYGVVPVENGGVPAATTDNNGQFLRVVSGSPTWSTISNAEGVAF